MTYLHESTFEQDRLSEHRAFLAAEARTARLIASYAIPAVTWAMFVVGIWCMHNTQRAPGELLTVMVATLGGSVGLTHLVRIVAGR